MIDFAQELLHCQNVCLKGLVPYMCRETVKTDRFHETILIYGLNIGIGRPGAASAFTLF